MHAWLASGAGAGPNPEIDLPDSNKFSSSDLFMMDKTALLGSVDDLVGGAIWRLGGGNGNGSASSFPRTDSETAFQEL
jgi:hypothetical protein